MFLGDVIKVVVIIIIVITIVKVMKIVGIIILIFQLFLSRLDSLPFFVTNSFFDWLSENHSSIFGHKVIIGCMQPPLLAGLLAPSTNFYKPR